MTTLAGGRKRSHDGGSMHYNKIDDEIVVRNTQQYSNSASDVVYKQQNNRVEVYIPPAKRRQLMEQQQQHQQEQQDQHGQKELIVPDASAAIIPLDTSTASVVHVDSRQQLQQQQHHYQKQKQTWDEQQRVIHGTVNRLNSGTIKPLIHDLFDQVNLFRLRGVLARSILLAAVSSVTYSPVYAALVAVLNTKLPEIGELIVHRSILVFRKSYRQRNKQHCVAIVTFFGHMFHQSIVHELIILQILTVLLENPTDDSVEVAVHLLHVTGYTLLEVSPAGIRGVFERLRALLHEGLLSSRIVIQLEALFQLRKSGFIGDDTQKKTGSSSGRSANTVAEARTNPYYPPIPPELDLVEAEDQITFDEIMLDDETIEQQNHLDTFHFVEPEQFTKDESEWTKIRNEVLGISDNSDDDGENETDDENDVDNGNNSDDDGEVKDNNKDRSKVEDETEIVPPPATSTALTTTTKVHDLSENDLVHLRRTIYLTIMSSATYEECAHKLSKIDIPMGREDELINMIIECCSQERTFIRYYGLISSRFCLLDDRWRNAFVSSFVQQYSTIHRLETNKLRNVAKLFAHLLHTDSIPWSVMNVIHLNEDETTSSSRIFIKIVLQEITEQLGMKRLLQRFEDPTKYEWYSGMFPKDISNVRNTKYAINFFTSIGLGPLTDALREFVKNAPKLIMQQQQELEQHKAKEEALVLAKKEMAAEDDDSLSTTTSSSSTSCTSSSSSSNSSSSSSGSSSGSSSSYSSSGTTDSSSSSSSSTSSKDDKYYSSRNSERRRDRDSRSDQRLKSNGSTKNKRHRSTSSSESQSSADRMKGRSRSKRDDGEKYRSKSNISSSNDATKKRHRSIQS